MALNKQIHIYSVDTSCFYNENEQKIHRRLSKRYRLRSELKTRIKKLKDKDEKLKEKYQKQITRCNKKIKELKNMLYDKFKKHKGVRELNPETLTDRKVISIFVSSLTRKIGIQENTLSKDLIVVQTYFFDILEDIIINGFTLNGEKYIIFTASAGQIRTKKTVFIKESVWEKCRMSLMCGLTVEKINSVGGVNINKYLAYLALCNSATDPWLNFDVTKAIVVEDMETIVRGLVDFIDDETYEITRKEMDIQINHTDGCGMYLPKVNNKSMMVRLPWVKGLLVPFSFDTFIQKANEENPKRNHGLIKDIYGREYDIIKDGVEVIFTKSQFKMWKFYDSWKQYQDFFIEYKCEAGKCNEEEDEIPNAKINYQMLQTLTDMTAEELETIARKTKYNIVSLGRDRKTMLKALGVKKSNINKNYLQQALEIYPELLRDTYSKEVLKQTKKSMVKQARAGRLDIDGKYTFIVPDLYAFCEHLFLGDKKPKGLIGDGEVFCRLYANDSMLDCLRAPHLYREHAVRKNIVDEEKLKWFVTDGLYTSCHDLISKILQFDVDGDKSLVCANKTIIDVAQRNIEGIVPLFYNMKNAKAEMVNKSNIYNGLKTAYTGGNIGVISNDITKIWNSENVDLDVIKLLCAENNFVIDYAKTLYKPKRPNKIKKMISQHTKRKVPHFFVYAKDKNKTQVEKVSDSVVNKLHKIIPNPNINFTVADVGRFNYKMLMSDKKVELDNRIIEKYTELDLKKYFFINRNDEKDKIGNIFYTYQKIREEILKINNDEKYVTDVLIEYLYQNKKSNFKTTLWECFGDVIVENLKNNIGKNSIVCDMCGKRLEATNNRQKYCKSCWEERHKQQDREYQRRKYKNSRLLENI